MAAKMVGSRVAEKVDNLVVEKVGVMVVQLDIQLVATTDSQKAV